MIDEVRGCAACGKLQFNKDEVWRDVDLDARDYASFMEHQIGMGPGRHNCQCELCSRIIPRLKQVNLW